MMRKVLKSLAILAAVLLLAGGTLTYFRSEAVINRGYVIDQPAIVIPGDSAGLARGRHLVEGVTGCPECHGDGLGGKLMINAPPFMRLAAPNLTRGAGGVASDLSDADWVHAIRHGVAPNGGALALMPSATYSHLSDADLGAIVAYLKTVPPMDSVQPPRMFGPISRLQIARGTFPLFRADAVDHQAVRSVSAPPAGPTLEYGRYLANIAGCTDCHGPGLSGGVLPGAPPGTPPPANITPAAIGGWSESQFAEAVREGKGGGGRKLNDLMPYRYFHFTDDELHALWLFVRSVEPKAFGNR